MEVALLSVVVMVLPLVLTGTSYGCIVLTILRMSSNVRRRKAFSTCSSHLTVVCVFYGTLIVVYMMPTEGLSSPVRKSISLLYTVIMYNGNHTLVSEIILLGFPNLHKFNILIFILLLIIYFVTINGNLLIIILVCNTKKLQSPMYFFLIQLSLSDILLTTDVVPNTLANVLNGGVAMSLVGCIAQFYIFGSSESFECLILTVMAYDRYLAICNPLRYSSIMNYPLFLNLILLSWLLGFSFILVIIITISTLDFCGPNVIDHFFCDMEPILELSCSETYTVHLEALIQCVPVILIPLMITLISYGCIVKAILKISSNTGRWKSFSTCSSHLTVVCMFYGTLISIYMLPKNNLSVNITKVISLLYTVVTPMLNPIIYSLRNKDIKEAAKMILLHN
ncbi:olfactory receptor 11L1-like [Mantella aurantiaca]